ncbi:MAG TPA: outer membrane beta-barrel protein [Prolixibacteraceae bacterium]|nr:outer membrane beta-barrel protein [Prolixibacteraceae bacterium]
MKTIICTLIAAALTTTLNAQQSADPGNEKKDLVTVASNDTIVETSQDADTSIIRIGKKEIRVIDRDKKHHEDGGDNYKWCYDTHKKDRQGKFDGHWHGIEIGRNNFDQADYSSYDGNEFMSLVPGKSTEVSINFSELNVPLIRSYVGLVTGMGLTFNSYRFENPITLVRGPRMVEPITLDYVDLSKSKLTVSYLKVPLLLEFQVPVSDHEGRLFVNAGLVGGMKLGSHTKIKHGDTKDKNRSGFYLNNFNYAATARVGYKDIGVFANYSLTPLFEKGKGPELTPYTIGLSFNFDE